MVDSCMQIRPPSHIQMRLQAPEATSLMGIPSIQMTSQLLAMEERVVGCAIALECLGNSDHMLVSLSSTNCKAYNHLVACTLSTKL